MVASMSMRQVVRECKMHGLSLRADGARAIEAYIRGSDTDEENALRSVIECVRAYMEGGEIAANTMIDASMIAKARADLENDEVVMEESVEDKVAHLDAWNCQELYYDLGSRKYMFKHIKKSRHSNAKNRVMAYRARYESAWERVSRNPGFSPRWSAAATYGGKTALSQGLRLERLDALRSTRDGGTVCVLGVLVQADDEAATIELEDPYGSAVADLSQANSFGGGYFAEGMVVVAEGQYDAIASIFRVRRLGHPPPETRLEAIKALGGPRLTQFGHLARQTLQSGELASPWIIVNELHLDAAASLPRLKKLLQGLVQPAAERAMQAEVPGPVLVMCGDFASVKAEAPAHAVRAAQARFAELATLLSSPDLDLSTGLPLLAHLSLIFVPGPRDLVCSPNRLLPRDKLPDSILQPLIDKLHRKFPKSLIIASTTPCRLQTPFGKEVLIHRNDTLKKLRRLSARLLPGNSGDTTPTTHSSPDHTALNNPGPHLAKTIIDQAHLAPFSLSLAPIYWDHDHALRLYPSPDALILADDSAPRFHTKYNDVAVANPGSFARDAAFLVLDPSNCSVQPSVIPS